MAISNSIGTNLTYLMNPKNYDKNPLTVAKDYYAPGANSLMDSTMKKGKKVVHSVFDSIKDQVFLSDEAKEEASKRGCKGIGVKTF